MGVDTKEPSKRMSQNDTTKRFIYRSLIKGQASRMWHWAATCLTLGTLGLSLISNQPTAQAASSLSRNNCKLASHLQSLRTLKHPDSYLEALQNGAQVPNRFAVSNLVGRVLRGESDSDFETLVPAGSSRRIIMLTEGRGLRELLGKSLRRILLTIGYTEEEIQRYQDRNTRFKIVVMPVGRDAIPATWENVLTALQSAYPGAVAQRVQNQLRALREVYQASGNPEEAYRRIRASAPSDSAWNSVNLSSFGQSAGSLWEVRAFLQAELNLNPLYTGDGYTRTPTGEIGVPELFMINRPLGTLTGARLLDLGTLSRPDRNFRDPQVFWTRPEIPSGRFGGAQNFNQWGNNVIQWGRTAQGARNRINQLNDVRELGATTPSEIRMARDFFSSVARASPSSLGRETAEARVQLMNHILRLYETGP